MNTLLRLQGSTLPNVITLVFELVQYGR